MKKLFLLFILGVVFVSCNPEKKYAKELSAIENYKIQLDSIKNLYDGIEYDSLVFMKNSALSYEKIVKKHYQADTIYQDFANKLSLLKGLRKSFKGLEINREAIKEELQALGSQFDNLETDIKNGVLNADQVKQFLGQEQAAFDKFNLHFKSIYLNQIKQKKNFYFANEAVYLYTEKIKPKEN